jgi:Tol biopolymer transport system component
VASEIGRQVAPSTQRERRIFVVQQQEVRLTAPSFAEISADGKWIVYVEGDNIRAMRLGADTTKLLLVEWPREQSPALSPDGRWLAQNRSDGGRPRPAADG